MISEYQIILPLEIREKIQYFVDKADKEISGLGDAFINTEAKTITIKSAFLLDQECTSTTTDLDEDAVSKAMFEAHKDEQENGTQRSIKFWWHSHVNMGVFWSGTDKETMSELSEHGWFCHIVFNKKREMLGAISYPVEMKAMGETAKKVHYKDEIPIIVPSFFSDEEKKALDAEMKAKYKEKKYEPPKQVGPATTPSDSTKSWRQSFGDNEYTDAQAKYFEDLYGPGWGRITRRDFYEPGDFLPDGAIVCHWGMYIKVCAYEPVRATESPENYIMNGTVNEWMPFIDNMDQLTETQYGLLDFEALQSMYEECLTEGDKRKFKKERQIIKKLYNEEMKLWGQERDEDHLNETTYNQRMKGGKGVTRLPN